MTLILAPNLKFPDEAITQTFALLAMRGAGKTNTARVMAEQMFARKLPFVAVDPVGSWWGLRASRDGKSAGLSLPIFGGPHGDVPLERQGGSLIADLVVDERLSCVLDLTGFDSEAAKKAFLLDFARRLYQRNSEPLHLFLEEADDYIPQKPMRDEAQLLRAWENIVRRGRARGLGMTLITQRSASINKNVLTQVDTLIAMRATSPQDRDVIESWLKYHAQTGEVARSLAELEKGEAWVWSPQWHKIMERVRFNLSTTFDSGATPDMKSGRAPATLADVDLDAVAKKMAATIERAKADDPKELRRTIAELTKKLKTAEGGCALMAEKLHAGLQPKIERVEVPTLLPGETAELRGILASIDEQVTRLTVFAKSITDAIARAESASKKPASNIPKTIPPDYSKSGTSNDRKQLAPRTNGGTTTARQQRFLDAAATLALLDAECTRNTVAAWVGVHPRGGSVGEELKALVDAGYIEMDRGQIIVTEAGAAHATTMDPTTATQNARAGLTPRQARFFQHIEDAYPDGITRERIAELENLHPRGGSLGEDLGRLVGRGLVEKTQGAYRLRDFLVAS